MSKSGSDVETDMSKVNLDRGGKSKREQSRDVVATMEKRLSKMENAVIEFDQRLEEDVLTKVGFGAVMEELQGQFQGALNSTLDSIRLDFRIKLDHFMAELTALCDEVKDVKGDWALWKSAHLMPKHVVQAIIAQTYARRRFVSSDETTAYGLLTRHHAL
ncbi:uncharacterized protein Pyn_19440 [Prunus yedoensis var. nudiflora]|uniref:Uncharacterized protein n=1 Tax=Prunus yedoensis var. nudiflora TaxID=2094558 RepID=A0A314XF45_PRUYE|nr:uncharacterized protein Pyn_19440 [Prunus yedoensis var. nudiflora]